MLFLYLSILGQIENRSLTYNVNDDAVDKGEINNLQNGGENVEKIEL